MRNRNLSVAALFILLSFALTACSPSIPKMPTQDPSLETPTPGQSVAVTPGISVPDITAAPIPTARADMPDLDVELALPLRCSLGALKTAVDAIEAENVNKMEAPETLEDGSQRYQLAPGVYLTLWCDPYSSNPLRILLAEYGQTPTENFNTVAEAIVNYALRGHTPKDLLEIAMLDGRTVGGGVEMTHVVQEEGHVLQLRPMAYDGDALPVTAEGFLTSFIANADPSLLAADDIPAEWTVSGEILSLTLSEGVTISAAQDSSGRLRSLHLSYAPSEDAQIRAKQEEMRRLAIESVSPAMKISLRTGSRMDISEYARAKTFSINQDWIQGMAFSDDEKEHLWLTLPDEDAIPPEFPALLNQGIQRYNQRALSEEIATLPEFLPIPRDNALLTSVEGGVSISFTIDPATSNLTQAVCTAKSGFYAESEKELLGMLRCMLSAILLTEPDEAMVESFNNVATDALIKIIGGQSQTESFHGPGFAAAFTLNADYSIVYTITAQPV